MASGKGILLVISGPAGSGKSTVREKLLATGEFLFSVSATTRAPRKGEVDGADYHFISREAFEERIRREEMLEYTEYCGNYYGTPKKETLEALEAGGNILLDIEVEGAENVKRLYPDAVLILLLPPSFRVQEERLRGRGSETEETVRARLEETRNQMRHVRSYDYLVVNETGGVDRAAEEILSVVRAERAAIRRHPDVETDYFEKDSIGS